MIYTSAGGISASASGGMPPWLAPPARGRPRRGLMRCLSTPAAQAQAASLGHVTTAWSEQLPLGSDRDTAVKRIQDAFAEGQISHQDLDERLSSVLAARTRLEVLAAVDSLPVPAEDRVVRIDAKGGRIRRSGVWQVPRVLHIESDFGSVDLDFCRAAFETPVIDVELQLRFGKAKITVPAGVVVDLDGLQTVWKQPRYTPPQQLTQARGPLIRISGSMEFGRLRIRHQGH